MASSPTALLTSCRQPLLFEVLSSLRLVPQRALTATLPCGLSLFPEQTCSIPLALECPWAWRRADVQQASHPSAELRVTFLHVRVQGVWRFPVHVV